ncbi:fe2+ zn2+ uptake regulation protein [Pseudomonas sp. Kh13]|uniref:fe2+ zn2+ uptake regulation protein n=1 Tax=Pseudomonas sp. Kh13 TaxID=2093744 RepID=UPI001182F3A5|nr:fe2+ zn2+ uptake regulation protein [Pseudomonas sp. Kh13]
MPIQLPAVTSRSIFEADRKSNQPIRELLSVYGLRFSLIRLKVIDALLVATREGRFIGAQGTHTQVQSTVAGCSFVSVREVLKRLCEKGVIEHHADKSYRFTARAQAMLTQRSG